jgi:hypothetical protein
VNELLELIMMKDKLVILVMGNRNSGKSYTWDALFGKKVNTSRTLKRLYFNDWEYIEVYLVSASPKERKKYVDDLIKVTDPKIVLCSEQYVETAKETINYFSKKGYFIYMHRLNPGIDDKRKQKKDELGILDCVLNQQNSLVGIRNAKINRVDRIREISDFLYGWANLRGLILKDNKKIRKYYRDNCRKAQKK